MRFFKAFLGVFFMNVISSEQLIQIQIHDIQPPILFAFHIVYSFILSSETVVKLFRDFR